MIFVTLTATNIFHKLNKWDQTEVSATVLGGEFNVTQSQRGSSYTTYELFIHYQDQKEKDYITKKAVTGTTYDNSGLEENITLAYRNSNVYDTFIITESTEEIWPAFINLYTFLIGLYLVTLVAMFRKYGREASVFQCRDESTELI